jgi:hypothetical protein
MKKTRTLVAFALSLPLCAAAARAQSTPQAVPTQSPAEAEAARQAELARAVELEEKAAKLLDETAGEAEGLRLAENRVRLQAAAAHMLWPRDEERARAILQSAQAGLATYVASLAPEDPRYWGLAHSINNLRREVALPLANRDPKLALEFVRATRVPPPLSNAQRLNQPDQELLLEAQLAEAVAARDPKEAVRMAEEILSRGVSGALTGLLDRVRLADPQAATKLAADIVRKLRGMNLSTEGEAAGVAAYLLRASRPPDPARSATNVVTSNPPQYAPVADLSRALVLDEQTRRDLISALINAALASANDPRRGGRGGGQFYNVLQQVMPEVERQMPTQAAALRRAMAAEPGRGERGPRPEVARLRELEQLAATGTVDSLLEAASKAPADARQFLYRSAASRAAGEGALDRARQIVNANFENAQEREQMLRDLDRQQFFRAAEQGDVSQAQALLARVKTPEERLSMMLDLARALSARGSTEASERLLEDAWALAAGRARNQSQFFSQLQIAGLYAQVAPARGFEIVESAVEQLNEMIAAAAVVDGFGQDAFEQGELKSGSGGYLWPMLVQQAGEYLSRLARADFDRAVAAADRLQRPEARLTARLALASGILGGGPPRSRGRRDNFQRGPARPRPVAPANRMP